MINIHLEYIFGSIFDKLSSLVKLEFSALYVIGYNNYDIFYYIQIFDNNLNIFFKVIG
jgi:hypothetical protein